MFPFNGLTVVKNKNPYDPKFVVIGDTDCGWQYDDSRFSVFGAFEISRDSTLKLNAFLLLE